MSYAIKLVSPADQDLDAIPDWAFFDVDNAILSLASFPELGRVYEPIYKTPALPIQMRVLYVRTYGIYYTVDHEHEIVRIRYIENQRMNPKTRFTGRIGG